MNIEVITKIAQFEALEDAWVSLCSQIGNASFFASYYYTRKAWDYFSGPRDELLIILLKENNRIVSIVPLRLSNESYWGIPVRVIRFIAEWEGDRPGILTLVEEREVWKKVLAFLNEQFTAWDAINFVEQPRHCSFLYSLRKHTRHYSIRELRDSTCYYTSIEGTWDKFFEARKASVRRNWRNRKKKLDAQPGLTSVEYVSETEQMEAAFDRFVEIEKSSWKADADQGVSKDDKHLTFNKDLALELAKNGMILISFLKVGDKDIAGAILYRYKETLYERHITYDDSWKKYSPGIILKAELIRYGFDKHFKQFDHLGMREGELHRKKHSQEWSTNEDETIKIVALKKFSRLLPVVIGVALRDYIRGFLDGRRLAKGRASPPLIENKLS